MRSVVRNSRTGDGQIKPYHCRHCGVWHLGHRRHPPKEDIVIGSRDTSVAARAVQLEAFRRLSPAERVAIALQMSEEARMVAADGFRYRHPAKSDSDADALRRLQRRAE